MTYFTNTQIFMESREHCVLKMKILPFNLSSLCGFNIPLTTESSCDDGKWLKFMLYMKNSLQIASNTKCSYHFPTLAFIHTLLVLRRLLRLLSHSLCSCFSLFLSLFRSVFFTIFHFIVCNR